MYARRQFEHRQPYILLFCQLSEANVFGSRLTETAFVKTGVKEKMARTPLEL